MPVSQNDDAPDSSVLSEQERSQFLARFESAWKSALEGSKPPEIEDFLQGLPKPHRPAMWKTLAEVDRGYRSRLPDSSAPQQNHPESVGTVTFKQQGTAKVRPDGSSGRDGPSDESAAGRIDAAHDLLNAAVGETIDSMPSPVDVSTPDHAAARTGSHCVPARTICRCIPRLLPATESPP